MRQNQSKSPKKIVSLKQHPWKSKALAWHWLGLRVATIFLFFAGQPYRTYCWEFSIFILQYFSNCLFKTGLRTMQFLKKLCFWNIPPIFAFCFEIEHVPYSIYSALLALYMCTWNQRCTMMVCAGSTTCKHVSI